MNEIFKRWWSATVAVVLLASVLAGINRKGMNSEAGHAVISLTGLALIAHAWAMQRRYAGSRSRLALLTLALCLPALASLWLGLNVIRYYAYNSAVESDGRIYSAVINTQGIIESLVLGVAVVVFIWTLFEIAHWLAMRIRA